MTIHRAKGLEFDHVLLPSLDRATRGAERRLLNWLDLPGESGASELLMAPVPAVGPAPRTADLNAYLRELVRQRDRHEHGRLLYVAATRARRTVWLSGAPRTAADGGVKPDPRSLLGLSMAGAERALYEPRRVRGRAGGRARAAERASAPTGSLRRSRRRCR